MHIRGDSSVINAEAILTDEDEGDTEPLSF